MITKDNFKNAFINAQIKATDKVMVHTALSKFYYVPGGPESVVHALEETINQGTIMMPSEVTTNCDPASWEYPPVRQDLIQIVRDNMPPYNPDTSLSEGLGITPEYFRNLPERLDAADYFEIDFSLSDTVPMDVLYASKVEERLKIKVKL